MLRIQLCCTGILTLPLETMGPKALKEEGVEFLVAPYEADAQMAYLALHDDVDAVLTEVRAGTDISTQAVYDVLAAFTRAGLVRRIDLLTYGCPKVGRQYCCAVVV